MRRFLFYSLLLLTLLWSTQVVAGDSVASPEDCLECHDDVTEVADFTASVHGANGCVACHIELTDIDAHMAGDLMPKPVDCSRCHKQEFKEYFDSVHYFDHPHINLSCTSCHSSIHDEMSWAGNKQRANAVCESCHGTAAGEYHVSVHSKGVAAGNQDSAACVDCHGLHAIASVEKMDAHDHAAFKTKPCMTCHADEEMMERNEVFPVAVDTYLESYHGKNFHLGYPEKVAGCADCHTAHQVLPSSDPASSLNPEQLVVSCSKCHENASSMFVKFYAHGDMNDSENYPILFYTYLAMSALLIGTFGVFWFHSLLWMFRGFIENSEKKKALAAGAVLHHVDNPHKAYRRFTKVHIFMHLLVITSFLLLSLTGLPLKFSDQVWAKVLMDFFGGSANAGSLHRLGAGITFIYFGMALFMSAKFLFYKLEYPIDFFKRLFGPESLCPNLRDIKDVTAMVRWFMFLGPKPTFDRWTYWEKFDFIAVFWGMFAIGGSGLMLWFPEFFGAALPGWVFNVATIIHSDEALLATGFIFTVHFFNTHGRPEKFPMDFVVFNGELPKEEFLEERGDQWKRYEEEGILENYEMEKTSGPLYDFILKGFGFTAVLIGVALTLLMIYAFIFGGHHF